MSTFNSPLWNEEQFNDAGTSGSVPNPAWGQYSLIQLRAMVQRELLDTTARWWTVAELNSYINDWQDELQFKFEFAWNTATVVVQTATLPLTFVATDILRLDAIYYNGKRTTPRSKEELDAISHNWRAAAPMEPHITYQDDSTSVSFWPPPNAVGTIVFEYPKIPLILLDTDVMLAPAWTRYSVINYGAYRAYLRAGPNQNISKALRYKAKFAKQVARYQVIKDNFFPDRSLYLKPGGIYEGQILNPNAPLIP